MKLKQTLTIILCLAFMLSFVSCNKKNEANGGVSGSADAASASKPAANVKLPDVVKGHMVFYDIGTVEFELYPNQARESVLNFIYLAQNGYFNGTIVHRVVKDFIIQAGVYKDLHERIETEFPYTIKGEFKKNGIENDVGCVAGTLVWMRDGNNDSASHEFGIYVDTNTCYQEKGSIAAFGVITKGMNVIQKINGRKTIDGEPKKQILITEVAIDSIPQPGFGDDFVFPEPNFIRKEVNTSTSAG